MNFAELFQNDIIIDEESFDMAIKDFLELSDNLKELQTSIENMLKALKEGFDTPAGRKFISAYEKVLLEPLKDQRIVINHVSENLNFAKNSYSSVFTDYSELNQAINNVSY